MKKIIFACFAALVIVSSVSCTKGEYRVYEDAIESKVYFVQAKESQLIEIGRSSLDEQGRVAFAIYNAGNNSEEITVNVSADQEALDIYNVEKGTSDKMLPEKYWSLEKTVFVMDTDSHYRDYVYLTVDFDALSGDRNVGEYMLALSVSVPNMQNVTYDYKTLFIKFKTE